MSSIMIKDNNTSSSDTTIRDEKKQDSAPTTEEINHLAKLHFRQKSVDGEQIAQFEQEFQKFSEPLLKTNLFSLIRSTTHPLYVQMKNIFRTYYPTTNSGSVSSSPSCVTKMLLDPSKENELEGIKKDIFCNLTDSEIEGALNFYNNFSVDMSFTLSTPAAKHFLQIGYKLTDLTSDFSIPHSEKAYSIISPNQETILKKLKTDWILKASIAFESILKSEAYDMTSVYPDKVNTAISDEAAKRAHIQVNGQSIEVTKCFSIDYNRYSRMDIQGDEFKRVTQEEKEKDTPRLINTLNILTQNEPASEQLGFLLQEMISQEPKKMGTIIWLNHVLENRIGLENTLGFICLSPQNTHISIQGGNKKPFTITYDFTLKTTNLFAMEKNLPNFQKSYDFKIIYNITYDKQSKNWTVNQPERSSLDPIANVDKIKSMLYHTTTLDPTTKGLLNTVLSSIANKYLGTPDQIEKKLKRILSKLEFILDELKSKDNNANLFNAVGHLLYCLKNDQSRTMRSNASQRAHQIPGKTLLPNKTRHPERFAAEASSFEHKG